MWRTHSKAGEDVSSSSYTDADHTVDPTETNRYCSDSDPKNKTKQKTLTSKPAGKMLTSAESSQRAAFQPARPW